MNIVRWDPFREIDSMFHRMMPRPYSAFPRSVMDVNVPAEFEWSPTADISETEKEYLIRAELPAVKKEDLKVAVEGGMLVIEGERRQEKEDKNEKFHRVENFHGTFMRRFGLPEDVDVDAIRCEDKDGVLTIRMPKKAVVKPEPKQIKIH